MAWCWSDPQCNLSKMESGDETNTEIEWYGENRSCDMRSYYDANVTFDCSNLLWTDLDLASW